MQCIWTFKHNHPPHTADVTAQCVQKEETFGLKGELCLLPVKLPLIGAVDMLCLPRRRFSGVTPQGSMVSCPHQHAVIIIIITHQSVLLVQVYSQPVGGGSDPPKQPHTATVKSEFKAMTGEQMLIESSAHNSSPSPSCF